MDQHATDVLGDGMSTPDIMTRVVAEPYTKYIDRIGKAPGPIAEEIFALADVFTL